MDGKVDRRFKARFVARYEQFEFHAGIMKEDERKPHFPARSIYTGRGKRKRAASAFTTVDGMKARRKRTKGIGPVPNIKQIYQFACKRARTDIVKAPFQATNSLAVRRLRKTLTEFFKSPRPMSLRRKVEEALVFVIRDPIRRKRYGSNSRATIRRKGFNRLLFDTGQLWRAMKAKVSRIRKATKNV